MLPRYVSVFVFQDIRDSYASQTHTDTNLSIDSSHIFLPKKQSAAARTASTTPALLALLGTTAAATAAAYSFDGAVMCDKVPVYGVPGTNRERTFLAVKPDGVQRGLVGE